MPLWSRNTIHMYCTCIIPKPWTNAAWLLQCLFILSIIHSRHPGVLCYSRVFQSDICHLAMQRSLAPCWISVSQSSTLRTMLISHRAKSILACFPPLATLLQTRGDMRAISCPWVRSSARELSINPVNMEVDISPGDSEFTGLPIAETKLVAEQESTETDLSSMHSGKQIHKQWHGGKQDARFGGKRWFSLSDIKVWLFVSFQCVQDKRLRLCVVY